VAPSEIDALEEAASAALKDRAGRMPEVMTESRRLMHDRDAEVRSRAVAIAWFAVRQMFQLLEPGARVTLCDAVSIDLEASLAAGLVGPRAMLGGALRQVLRRLRDSGGVIEDDL